MDLTKTVEALDSNVTKIIANERDIAASIGDIIAYLERVDLRFAHLEGHIGQLSKRPAVMIKPRGRLGTLVLVGTAVYVGYKLSDRRVQEKLQEMAKQAKEQAEQTLRDTRIPFEEQPVNKQSSKDYGTYPKTRSVDATNNDI